MICATKTIRNGLLELFIFILNMVMAEGVLRNDLYHAFGDDRLVVRIIV